MIQCFLNPLFSAGFIPHLCEKTLFLLRSLERSAQSFDRGDVDSAYICLNLFLYRNEGEDVGVAHQGHDPWTDFSFYDRNFGAAEIFGRIIYNHLRQSGFFQGQTAFIDDKHRHGL